MRHLALLAMMPVAGAVALAQAPAQAAEPPSNGVLYEVKGGVLAHDVPDLWSGTNLEHGVTLNGEVAFAPSFGVLWGRLRPTVGASVTTAGGTSFAYADLHYQLAGPTGLFFSVGVGGAVHDGKLDASSPDQKALGSRVLFHVPLEAGIEFAEHYRVSVYFEHISNGYLASPNEGLDNLGVRLGYRF